MEQVDAQQTYCVGHRNNLVHYISPNIYSSNIHEDNSGTKHLVMHFYAQGPKAKGTVNLHMTKKYSDDEFVYKFLALDVPGHQRLYLENADTASNSLKGGVTKMFGVKWTR